MAEEIAVRVVESAFSAAPNFMPPHDSVKQNSRCFSSAVRGTNAAAELRGRRGGPTNRQRPAAICMYACGQRPTFAGDTGAGRETDELLTSELQSALKSIGAL